MSNMTNISNNIMKLKHALTLCHCQCSPEPRLARQHRRKRINSYTAAVWSKLLL